MSTHPFATPAASTGITWGDQLGKLLLVEPTSHEQGIVTSLGEKDAIRATVSVITGPGEAEVFEDCLIFPRVLQGQLRSRIGQQVLGRLGQGVAKSGQSAPWMLLEATEDDIAKGIAYLDARKAQTVVSAAPAASAAPAPAASDEVPF